MNIEAFLAAPWHIQLHALSALAALGVGAVQFGAPKGTIPHRTLGYVWVGLMVATAVTAIFIRQLNDGAFSWIHIFVPLTLFGVVELSIRARRGLTGRHRNSALGMFLGALLVPGALSFLPGRLMWETLFGG
ncbi:DUF2306 domain-containing protein [Marinicauda salina]|nr:DUF2306 domain-containing protein [Marinicauda salina]